MEILARPRPTLALLAPRYYARGVGRRSGLSETFVISLFRRYSSKVARAKCQ